MDAPKLISEEQLYKWYGKRVLKRTYQMPDGSQEEFFVFGGETPVIIFPLTENEEVIAVWQFRYGAGKSVLELPGGIIRQGATELDTVSRELLEETGYKAKQINQVGAPTWFDPASWTNPFLSYFASGCRKIKDPEPDKTEILETVLVAWQEWVRMIFRGEVRDSKSITTTLLALAFWGRSHEFQDIYQQILREASF